MKAEIRNPKAHGSPKPESRKVLVCFAVKEEARAFENLRGKRSNVKVILVGMGKRNAEQAIRAGEVEVSLVDGGHFDEGGELEEDGVDAVGVFAVAVRVAVKEDGVGAELGGGAEGECGVDAELAGFVGGGRDHRATR